MFDTRIGWGKVNSQTKSSIRICALRTEIQANITVCLEISVTF